MSPEIRLLVSRLHWERPMWTLRELGGETSPLVRSGIVRPCEAMQTWICECGLCDAPEIRYRNGRFFFTCASSGMEHPIPLEDVIRYGLHEEGLAARLSEAAKCGPPLACKKPTLWSLGTSQKPMGCFRREVFFLRRATSGAIESARGEIPESAILVLGCGEPKGRREVRLGEVFSLGDGTCPTFDFGLVDDNFGVAPRPKKEKAPSSRTDAVRAIDEFLEDFFRDRVHEYEDRRDGDVVQKACEALTQDIVAKHVGTSRSTVTRCLGFNKNGLPRYPHTFALWICCSSLALVVRGQRDEDGISKTIAKVMAELGDSKKVKKFREILKQKQNRSKRDGAKEMHRNRGHVMKRPTRGGK